MFEFVISALEIKAFEET